MHFKNSLMYGISKDRGRLMKTFRLDTICNISQEPQELQKFNYACRFIGEAVIKYHKLLSKVTSIDGKPRVDQLATASTSTPPQQDYFYLFFSTNFHEHLQ